MTLIAALVLLQGDPKAGPQEFEAKFQSLEAWEEEGLEIVYMSGAVEIRSGDGSVLKADRVIGWRRKLGPRPPDFDELYAEGAVTMETTRSQITAESLFFDRKLDRAFILKFVMRGESQPGSPVVFRAREARRLAADRYIVEEAEASTCVYGTPHYAVRISRAEITVRGADPRDATPRDRGWSLFPTGGDIYVAADDISLWYGAVPVFYFPGLTYRLGDDLVLRSIRAGSSGRFGTFVYTEWGLSFDTGEGRDRKRWGDLIFEIDYRRVRGWAGGVDFHWNTDPARGYLDTYGLNDRGPNPRVDFEQQFIPLEDDARGRARMFHRHDLSESVRYEAEASYLSDRNLLQEFFPREFKEGKEQESTLYFRGLHGNAAWFAQARARMNDFQTQLEYLPRFEIWWLGDRLGFPGLGPAQYSYATQIVNFRQTFDETLGTSSFRTERVDSLHEMSVPFDFGPVQLVPYGAVRLGAWGDDLMGERETRVIALMGFGVRTQFSRIFDVTAMGLDGLRHVIDLQARWMNAYVEDFDPMTLFRFDNVDRLTNFEEVTFEIVQRFQTRGRDAKGELAGIHEFLEVGLAVEYYPDSDRDTIALAETSFAYPFDPMGIFPLPGRPFARRRWSNVFWRLNFTPHGPITLRASGEYDPVGHEEVGRDAGVSLNLDGGGSISVSNTFVKDGTNTFTFAAVAPVTPKWTLDGLVQYDYRTRSTVTQRFGIARDLHDLVLHLSFEIDRGQDDVRILFRFEPKFAVPR
ncbi:MAG TPA: hypothetical protein VI643_07175 [Planctomycetota bacterium]|nr:hypothetical protein [Planctomycetota bacterium]